MAFNQRTIPSQVLDRIFRGIESEEMSLLDMVGTRLTTRQLAGTIPTLASAQTLASPGEGGIAEGAAARKLDRSMGSTTYALKRYVGATDIPYGVIDALDDTGLDTLAYMARECRKQANSLLDADVNSILASTSLNKTTAASNPWDGASGTPLEDIQTAARLIGRRFDTVVMGADVSEALQLDADFKARVSFYAGGVASEGDVATVLRALYPQIRNVVIGSHVYNSANEGQAATLAYRFDGLFWMGDSANLVLMENPNNQTGQQPDEVHESVFLRYTRRADPLRLLDDRGVNVTSVVS
jgi:hypothetical protein